MSQQLGKLLQGAALLWETVTQYIGKMVEALSQGIGLTTDSHLVEAIGIEPLPRKFEQSQRLKGLIERLALGQTTHIVQTSIKLHVATPITLQASARLSLSLQYHHASSALCQLTCTNQTSQSTAYDNDIVLHELTCD